MFKKTILITAILAISSFANNTITKTTMVSTYKAGLADKVFIDCKHTIKTRLFGMLTKKRYLLKDPDRYELEKLYASLCKVSKDKNHKVTIGQLLKTAKETSDVNVKYNSFIDSIEVSNGNTLNEEMSNKIRNFRIKLEYEYIYPHPYVEMLFHVVEINEPAKVMVTIFDEIDGISVSERTNSHYIKKYKADGEIKEIATIELEGSSILDGKKYTNDYDINYLKECIDGKVWIKKYGKQSGDKCVWILKAEKK